MIFIVVVLLSSSLISAADLERKKCADIVQAGPGEQRAIIKKQYKKRPGEIEPRRKEVRRRRSLGGIETPSKLPSHKLIKEAQMVIAARSGNISELKKLLESNFAPDEGDDEGITALMVAARRNDVPTLQLLLEHKANPAQENSDYETALQIAVKYDQREAEKVLARAEPNVDVNGIRLIEAAKKFDFKTVQQLLDNDPTLVNYQYNGKSPLFSLLLSQLSQRQPFSGIPEPSREIGFDYPRSIKNSVELLLNAGANPFMSEANGWDAHAFAQKFFVDLSPSFENASNKSRALLGAVQNDNVQEVENLLKQKANPNIPSGDMIILHEAIMRKNIPIIKLLLNAGANPNFRNKCNQSSLELAYPNAAIMELLMNAGVSPDTKTWDERHLLGWAVFDQNKEIEELFSTRSKIVQLVRAATKGDIKDIEALLSENVPVDPIILEVTPLLFAALEDQNEAAALLLKKGANVNAAGEDGSTALIVAAHRGNFALVQLLLDHKANPLATNTDGITALDFAIQSLNSLSQYDPPDSERATWINKKADYSRIIALLQKEIAARKG